MEADSFRISLLTIISPTGEASPAPKIVVDCNMFVPVSVAFNVSAWRVAHPAQNLNFEASYFPIF